MVQREGGSILGRGKRCRGEQELCCRRELAQGSPEECVLDVGRGRGQGDDD